MQVQAREIKYFFYSQAFADGIRTSLAIVTPALLGYYFNFFEVGLAVSLGAMCVSLSDSPGPIRHRRNGMLACTVLVALVALLTSVARFSVYTMGLQIAAVTFLFSMFNVYGSRAASVGNAAILIMILSMDKPVPGNQFLLHALLIFIGGAFYTVFSMLLNKIRPYRIAQRFLGDCIREMANYVYIKASFYDVNTSLDENYKKLVAQQVTVNEKQDAVRELFFKTRQIVKESTNQSRRLIFTFVKTVDLFEDITAAYYDYELIRKNFAGTGALKEFSSTLQKLGFELDAIGFAIQANTSFTKTFDYDEALKQLKYKIDLVAPKNQASTLVLRKILVNLRKMLNGMNNIVAYFNRNSQVKKSDVDHSHFVSHQSLDPKAIADNFSYQSGIFRHALRVSIACVAGFAVANVIDYGHHSYWVVMTIAFMLKPAFSLTKERNKHRIIGTLGGGAVGVLILLFIPNKTVLFFIMLLFMIGTYSFMRIRYLIMVIFTTPYVLILFALLGTSFKTVAQERVFDTILGCTIAFAASYVLFPQWESGQLTRYMRGIVKANAMYLQKIIEALNGRQINMLEYKLARKEVYLNSANLSAAFHRMVSEPKNKQKNEKLVHQFVVLNHILFSNIASLATSLLSREQATYTPELLAVAKRAVALLIESSRHFEHEITVPVVEPQHAKALNTPLSADDQLTKDQLNFILNISADIEKTTRTIIAS